MYFILQYVDEGKPSRRLCPCLLSFLLLLLAIFIIKLIEQSHSSQRFMEPEGSLPHHMSPPPVPVVSPMNTVRVRIPRLEDPF